MSVYKTKKKYSSNGPKSGKWNEPIELGFFNNRSWKITIRKNNQAGWIGIRLYSEDLRNSKAQFSLGFNGERFAEGHDYKIMKEHYPFLEKMILTFIESA